MRIGLAGLFSPVYLGGMRSHSGHIPVSYRGANESLVLIIPLVVRKEELCEDSLLSVSR